MAVQPAAKLRAAEPKPALDVKEGSSPVPQGPPAKPALIRAVYGRMVDLHTNAEYLQEAAREEVPSGWLDSQVAAGKLVRE